jgi:hypothetical protein
MGALSPTMLRNRRRNAPRPAWKVTESYLAWLRKRPCYLAGHRCGGCGDVPGRKPVEAAHVNHAGDAGMATKASDRNALPLCPRHHDEQHGKIGSFQTRGGWMTFQQKYGFNAMAVAADYWAAWLKTASGVRWLAEGEDPRG